MHKTHMKGTSMNNRLRSFVNLLELDESCLDEIISLKLNECFSNTCVLKKIELILGNVLENGQVFLPREHKKNNSKIHEGRKA